MAGVLIRTAQAMGAYDDDPAEALEAREALAAVRAADTAPGLPQ